MPGFRTTYKVTIEEIRESETPLDAKWKQVRDTGDEMYGYVIPPGTQLKRDETTIFFQEVGEIDLVKVIKAVNGVE